MVPPLSLPDEKYMEVSDGECSDARAVAKPQTPQRKERKRIPVFLNFVITTALRAILEAYHPQYMPVESRDPRPSGHPRLHYQRAVALHVCHQAAVRRKFEPTQRIIDVGARKQGMVRFDWHLMPVVSAADALRATVPKSCNHRLEECGCLRRGDILVLCHTLYYITPETLLNALVKTGTRAFVAIHHFPTHTGVFCDGEARYTHLGPRLVEMQVAGGERFVHNPLHWVQLASRWAPEDPSSPNALWRLVWNCQFSIGDTHIYEFGAEPGRGYSGPAVNGPGFALRSDVNLASLAASDNGMFKVESRNVTVGFSPAGAWYVSGCVDSCLTEKGLVTHLAILVAGRPRDQTTRDYLFEKARSWWSKPTKDTGRTMPDSVYSSAGPVAVEIAMLIGVDHETSSAEVLATHSLVLNRHERARVDWRDPDPQEATCCTPAEGHLRRAKRLWWYLVCTPCRGRGPDAGRSTFTVAFLSQLQAVAALPSNLTVAVGWFSALLTAVVVGMLLWFFVITPVLLTGGHGARNTTVVNVVVAATTTLEQVAIRDGCTFVPSDAFADCKTREVAKYIAVTTPPLDLLPRVLAGNQTNEVVGITRRMMPAGMAAVDPRSLRMFGTWATSVFTTIFATNSKLDAIPFDEWNARFSKAVQDRNVRARRDWDNDASDAKIRALAIKYFVKSELSLKHANELLSPVNIKPRIISNASPHYNVVVGPWVAAIQGWMKKKRRRGTPFGESDVFELGNIISDARDRNATFVENDFDTFDACQTYALRALVIGFYQQFFGLPDDVAQLMLARAKEKRGWTMNGVKVKLDGTMASGDPDTYLSNTILNVLLQYWVGHHAGAKPGRDVRVLASGDDSVVIVENPFVERYVALKSDAIFAALGFTGRRSIITDPFDPAKPLGYCSATFAQVDRLRFALLPKAGRVLAKVVWQKLEPNQTLPDPKRYKGDLLGLWPSGRYVPLLREFLASELVRLETVIGAHPSWAQWTSKEDFDWHNLPPPTSEQLVWTRFRYGDEAEALVRRGGWSDYSSAKLLKELLVDME